MARSSGGARLLTAVAVVVVVTARRADAGFCDNPFHLAPGDVATQFSVAGKWQRTPLFRQGAPIELHVGRQRGTCGGLEPVPAADVVATAARAADGQQQPLTGTSSDGDKLVWTPPEAGVYFLTVAERGGKARQPDRLVLIVAASARRVQLRVQGAPHNEGLATVRVRPPGEAEAHGFASRRWQRVYQGEAMLKTAQPLELADGEYEVQWQVGGKHPRAARWTFRVSADGELVTTVPRPQPK